MDTNFISAFREAAPYIHYLNGKTIVLSVGSHIVRHQNFPRLARDIALLNSLGMKIVLIHGVRGFLEDNGMAGDYVRDYRVTTHEAMEEIKRSCGSLRLDIEAALGMCFLNTPANTTKLSIAGGNFILAQPLGVLDGVDMQRTGQVRKIDSEQIKRCLANNQIVLISPVGHSVGGISYNLSLPETAAAIASALGAEKLVFLCRANGIRDEENAVIPDLSIKDALQYCQKNPQHEDIMRSIQAAQTALKNGVSRVQIIDGREDGALLKELFTRTGFGTALANNSLTQIRPAEVRDIPDLMRLIEPLIQRGNLLPRTKNDIERHLAEFVIAEHDRLVYGCAALKSFVADKAGEIYCLAVSDKGRGMGYGDLLLQSIENMAVKQGLTQLFALTTRTADWFLERGFEASDLNALPAIRRKQYIENKRNSKIFVKQPKSSPFQAA